MSVSNILTPNNLHIFCDTITANNGSSTVNFSGTLDGNISGTQKATIINPSVIVNSMISSSAAISDTKLATITSPGKIDNSALNASFSNITNTLVLRDNTGSFGATNITGHLIGNADTATLAATTVDFTGNLAGNVSGPQSATVISANAIVNSMINSSAAIQDSKLAQLVTPNKVANTATSGISTNTGDTLVLRDVLGNFSAGTITATLNGSATSTTNSVNFTGSLAGNITGTQTATVIAPNVINNSMINSSAAIQDSKLAQLVTAGKVANSATSGVSTNTNNTLVLRDGSGNFSATTITANLVGNSTTATTTANFSGNLAGDITGTQSATTISPNAIFDSMINSSAAIQDSKLAQIVTPLKVANSATTATDANTSLAIVNRDVSGNFSANLITSSLNGNVIGNVSGNSANFTGSLAGVVTGTQGATTITAAKITNSMLATITAAGKVSNSATTATAAGTNGTIVLRDTAGTNLVETFINGNLTFFGYRAVNLGGGNSVGSLYTAFPALADGVYLAYNFYYPNGSMTPIISNAGGGTSQIDMKYGEINFGTGGTNTAPTTYFNLSSTGVLAAQNGGTISAPLTGNVTGNISGGTGSFSSLTSTGITTTAGITSTANVNITGNIIASVGIQGATLTGTTSVTTPSLLINGGSSLSNYTTGTFTGSITGPYSGTITCAYERIGNQVTIRIQSFSGIAGGAPSTGFTITGTPAALIPSTFNNTIMCVQDASTMVTGVASIQTGTGDIFISKITFLAYTSTCGIYPTTIVYLIV